MSVVNATPEDRHALVLACESAAVKLSVFTRQANLKGLSERHITELDAAVTALQAAVDLVANAK